MMRLVAHFKNWKIFHSDYRRPYSTYDDAFDAGRGLFFFSILRHVVLVMAPWRSAPSLPPGSGTAPTPGRDR
jgi:hypothetical protein